MWSKRVRVFTAVMRHRAPAFDPVNQMQRSADDRGSMIRNSEADMIEAGVAVGQVAVAGAKKLVNKAKSYIKKYN